MNSSVANNNLRNPLTWAIVVIHAVVFFAWSWFRNQHFGSHGYDLGSYHNIFWQTAFRSVPWNSVERIHQWSAHFEVGLLVLWIPYRICPTVAWLFLLQSVGASAGALVVDAHVRHVTQKPLIGAVAATGMLLTPQLLFAEIYDFHSITVCVFPVALLVYGIARNSVWRILLGSIIALSLREQMGLAVAVGGIIWALREGKSRRLAGTALVALGLGVFLVEVLWLIPSFANSSVFRYAAHYQRLGASPSAALQTVLQHPFEFLMMPFEGGRKVYLLKLAAGALPLLILSFRSIRQLAWPLLLGAPLLAVQLFADSESIWSVRYQYGAPLVPLLAVTAGLSLGSIGTISKRWAPLTRSTLTLILAAGWLIFNLSYSVSRVGVYAIFKGGPLDFSLSGSPRETALQQAFALIPSDASVSAQDGLVAHLGERETIHEWPDGEKEDRFVILDVDGLPGDANNIAQKVSDGAARLRIDGSFRVVFDQAGVLLLERKEHP